MKEQNGRIDKTIEADLLQGVYKEKAIVYGIFYDEDFNLYNKATDLHPCKGKPRNNNDGPPCIFGLGNDGFWINLGDVFRHYLDSPYHLPG